MFILCFSKENVKYFFDLVFLERIVSNTKVNLRSHSNGAIIFGQWDNHFLEKISQYTDVVDKAEPYTTQVIICRLVVFCKVKDMKTITSQIEILDDKIWRKFNHNDCQPLCLKSGLFYDPFKLALSEISLLLPPEFIRFSLLFFCSNDFAKQNKIQISHIISY